MGQSHSASSEPASPRPSGIRWPAAGVILGASLVIGVVLVIGSRNAPAPPTAVQSIEVHRSELVLDNGRLRQIGHTNFFNGALVEYYEGGALKSHSMISSGLLEGLSEGWHTNGQLQVRELFKQGVSHGLRTKWYDTGVRRSEASIVNGQLEGPFRQWHENGALAEQIEFRAGQPHGLALAYFESGSLKAKAAMERGNVVDRQSWADGASVPAALAQAEPRR